MCIAHYSAAVVYAMAPPGLGDSLVRTITEEGELSWEKCLAASEQKLLGEKSWYVRVLFFVVVFLDDFRHHLCVKSLRSCWMYLAVRAL